MKLRITDLARVTVFEIAVIVGGVSGLFCAACVLVWNRLRILARAYWRREYGPLSTTGRDVAKLRAQEPIT